MHDIGIVLKELIASCRDSEEGFGKAAKSVKSENLRTRFAGIARQRADFANELSEHLHRMGQEPPAIQHRGWLVTGTGIRSKDDMRFLAECEAGEENTLRHYEHALTLELPAAIQPMVNRQRLAVQEALLDLRDLEQLKKAS
jgi:uncharacterized protein (TIGR02284 family)